MTPIADLTVTTPSDREITMTRVFDAPRSLVFDALTQPELLKRWGGGAPGWSLVVCDVDLRVGGAWRWVTRGPDGSEMGLRGVYQEIVRPERLVTTESFDDPWYPGEALDTTVLVEHGGKTRLTTTVLYPSREVRDAVLKTPMARGVAQGYDRLEDLLASTLALGAQIDQMTRTNRPTANRSNPRLRSAAAVLAGFVVVVILSLGTDQVLHLLKVYPPWGEPMYQAGLNLLALSYRCGYAVLGSYLAARLAPSNPMRHALVLGAVGLILSLAGAVVASSKNLGPTWYPVALAITSLPLAWVGGRLHRGGQTARG